MFCHCAVAGASLVTHARIAQVPLTMLLFHGPEDLSFDPGPEPCTRANPGASSASDPPQAAPPAPSPAAPSSRTPERHPGAATNPPRTLSPEQTDAAAARAAGWSGICGMQLLLSWVMIWTAALWVLADASLARHAEHAAGAWLPCMRPTNGKSAHGPDPADRQPSVDDYWDGAAARHWAAESYGFALQACPPRVQG